MATGRPARIGLVVCAAAVAWAVALGTATVVAGDPLFAGLVSGVAVVVLVVALILRSPLWAGVPIALLALSYAQTDPSLVNAGTAAFAVGLVVLAELLFFALAVMATVPPALRAALPALGRIVVGSAAVVAVVALASSVSLPRSAWLVPLGFAAAVAGIGALLLALREATESWS